MRTSSKRFQKSKTFSKLSANVLNTKTVKKRVQNQNLWFTGLYVYTKEGLMFQTYFQYLTAEAQRDTSRETQVHYKRSVGVRPYTSRDRLMRISSTYTNVLL